MFLGTGNAWGPRGPDSAVPVGGGAAPSLDAPAQSDGVRAETRQSAAGVLEELSGVLASTRAALSNFIDLISLEARHAGLALMWMVVWAVVAAICIVGAWLGLMAAIAMWAVSLGFPPIAAVIAVAAINLIAGAALIYACIGASRDLLFSATRRQVAGKSTVKPPAP
jgi:hypothetical protein